MKKNILLIGGTLNQTTMMHQIAQHLERHHCYFTPFFDDGLLGIAGQNGWIDFSILGRKHRHNTETYLKQAGLPVDIDGRSRSYDLIITGTDLIVPKRIFGKRMVLVQEGMMEPEGMIFRLVRSLKLPRYLANTAMTGLSDAYALFCVASSGYRDVFVHKGVNPDKIAVTGIPNFDNVHDYCRNDFPQRDYVLAATSARRETLQWDHRPGFIRKVKSIAQGRPIIFKLHPNENQERAIAEIREVTPEAQIFTNGNINHMIANCQILVTQTSSVTYIGLALGKEVYSDLDVKQLRQLTPIQNGGKSAHHIAEQCEAILSRTRAGVSPATRPTLQRTPKSRSFLGENY